MQSGSAYHRDDESHLKATLMRVNARAWGIAMGVLLAVVLFVATNVLVLRGGPEVGPHLALLGVFLPGYRVTFLGSVIGFVYMFVIGYGLGWLLGRVYNAVAGKSQ
jgi:uncharacterized membrane protein (DUF485 family)